MKPIRLAALLASLGLSASCTTTYDAYGSPRQSVDPGVALMGVAAAGIAGYAISNSRNNDRYDGYGGGYSSGSYTNYQSNYYGSNDGYYGGGDYYGGGYSSCY